jgi:hypothetical protein
LHRREIADQRAGVRLRRLARLGAAARLHHHDRFAGRASAAARGEEFRRPAHLLAIDRDHPGRAVVSQELDEVGAFEAGLVAGRDHVGERKAAPVDGALEVAEQAAALADEGNAALDPAQRLARVQHVQPYAIDVVGDAEAIGSDHGKARRARGVGDGILGCLIADLGKTGGEYQRRADLAPRAGLDRFAHRRRRQREDGKIHAFGQLVCTLEHGPAINRLAAPADQVDIALEVVELERLQNDLAGAARARRHSHDRHRARAQESCDRLGAARVVRSTHLSGWNKRRCVPSSSGCQYGFTFMPTFSSSALQLTISAMKLTPTSSVTLTTA